MLDRPIGSHVSWWDSCLSHTPFQLASLRPAGTGSAGSVSCPSWPRFLRIVPLTRGSGCPPAPPSSRADGDVIQSVPGRDAWITQIGVSGVAVKFRTVLIASAALAVGALLANWPGCPNADRRRDRVHRR